MDELSKRYLDHAPIPFKEVAGTGKAQISFDRVPIAAATCYAAEDADVTLRLWHVLKPRLAAERMTTVYETLERPLAAGAGAHGAARHLDRPAGAVAAVRRVRHARRRARGRGPRAGRRAVQHRQPQAARRHPVRQDGPARRQQDRDRPVVDRRRVLETWPSRATSCRAHPRLAAALQAQGHLHRRPAGLRRSHTGRVHTSYSLAATTTGRLSSSEPNLQNIPIRTEEGRKIRHAFIATPGHKLITADYTQIELRLLAHIGDIPQLKQAFRDGIDIHAMTASEMFGVPVKGMPAEVRRRAKAINFGIVYGISAFGLANQLGIPREEAGAYIKNYFERFPGIRDYMEATKAFAAERLRPDRCSAARATTPTSQPRTRRPRLRRARRHQRADPGRRRRHHPPRHGAHGRGAGQAKLAAQMLLQVHDELVFEAPEAEVERRCRW